MCFVSQYPRELGIIFVLKLKGVFMKQDISVLSEQQKSTNMKSTFRNFFVLPVSSGIFGFALFFTILLLTKFIAYGIGSIPKFIIDLDDVVLSLIGFVLMGLIKLLENFQKN